MPEVDKLLQLGAGGALFLCALWMILKFKPWARNGNGKLRGTPESSGEKDPAYWREAFREIVKEVIESEFKERNEQIRKIVREELQGMK